MASKTEETPHKEEMPEREGPETLPDDLSAAAIKKTQADLARAVGALEVVGYKLSK